MGVGIVIPQNSIAAMRKNKTGRRNFIKTASMGLGSLSIAPLIPPPENTAQKKLQIVCVGAHPGDPEFGCGGTMAKFVLAGHSVTFLYLTRGEAYDPGKSFGEAAALRTKEAERSCEILHAKPLFAGLLSCEPGAPDRTPFRHRCENR
jgi:hypothetical protein